MKINNVAFSDDFIQSFTDLKTAIEDVHIKEHITQGRFTEQDFKTAYTLQNDNSIIQPESTEVEPINSDTEINTSKG